MRSQVVLSRAHLNFQFDMQQINLTFLMWMELGQIIVLSDCARIGYSDLVNEKRATGYCDICNAQRRFEARDSF